MSADDRALVEIEIDLLLEGVYRHHGYDFRDYARASLRRRVRKLMAEEGVDTVSALQQRVLHEPGSLDRLVETWTVNVTSMFRGPGFFAAFREHAVPLLRTYPFVRIWVAGCSSGEEVYSLAILLREEGLEERSRIYATDLDASVLETAQAGIFALGQMKEYTENYQRSGGQRSFSEYYTARYDRVVFDPSLRDNVVFSRHNLVTDGSFNEFQAIVCRNVMIYFNRDLQHRVHQLFLDSLCSLGVLGLGGKETLRVSAVADRYEALDRRQRLFRKRD
jgi:chemotaxis protein methyltransferase CheR